VEYNQDKIEEMTLALLRLERLFEERRKRANDAVFLRILNREGGEPPRPEDTPD